MMQRSLTVPLLPCRLLDESIPFYEALGFTRTFRQDRPNPAAALKLDSINIHLFGIDGFDPADSYGSALILVSDPDQLYRSFAAGLRDLFGKLPAAGIPRILRPRKRHGITYGFSVVDPGGNWLRFAKLDDNEVEDEQDAPATGLAKVIENAGRMGDSLGDEATAIRLLTNGLTRHPDAPVLERVRALLYRAQLAVRTENAPLARTSFETALGIDLNPDEQTAVAEEVSHTEELLELTTEQPNEIGESAEDASASFRKDSFPR
jgi:catechol 2,3-dioxygenase-like lactoylglutathione lyase family enzyme